MKTIKLFKHFSVLIAIAAAFSLASCAKKQLNPEEGSNSSVSVDDNVMGDSDSGHAMGLKTIHFEYDSAVLGAEAKAALAANAAIMKEHGSLKVQIEGHCDQRGGTEYNIALGERRANAVRNYLEDLKVTGARMTIISYGKERLLDPADNEAAYAKNRRANFAITSK